MNRVKVLDIISFFGSVASIVSLFWINSTWNGIKIFLLVLLLAIGTISMYLAFFLKDTKVCRSQEKINDFMKQWIDTDGVVKILSRDLSWVDKEMMKILWAKGKDLNLYIESENNVVKEIVRGNPECKVYFYGAYDFEPNSRYTIIHANKDDRQIAIALQERKNYKKLYHEIYISEDNAYDKKMLGLATDLMKCIECMDRNE